MSDNPTPEQDDDMTTEKLVELACFEPAIKDEEVGKMEKVAQENGVGRRIMLVMLSKDAKFLRKMRIENPDVFAETMKSIEGFREHIKAAADLAESCYPRMTITDCWVASGGGVGTLGGDKLE